MDPIETLKQEHRDIERELSELDMISKSDSINYPNLVHVFKNLIEVWNKHEEKEEKFFPILEKEQIKVHVEKMLFEHKKLKVHKQKIIDAINSGSEINVKKVLNDDGKKIAKELKQHIDDEDKVLYGITIQIFSQEEIKEMWDSLE